MQLTITITDVGMNSKIGIKKMDNNSFSMTLETDIKTKKDKR